MGFIRAEIDYKDKLFVVKMYYSWLYVSEQLTSEKTFDTLEDAKEWILQERCYNKLVIKDEARNALSYRDALTLQLNKKQYHEREPKNTKMKNIKPHDF